MAQNFVGSNNINLFLPIGQFGTRNQGGKEAASPRYIFTNLSGVTRYLFHEDDDALLNYLEEEGQSIEPDYYLPIIPMSLINGADGIGTGWSTSIPCFNPRDVVKNLRSMMTGAPYETMYPWYKGFQGVIEPTAPGSRNFTVRGVYRVLGDEETSDELEITELPIGKWTRDYKNFLEELAAKDEIEEIREYHTENRVHFIIKVPKLQQIIASPDGIEKKFKLTSSISANNYVLFDYEGRIKRYISEEEIIREFFVLRKELYERRKAHMLASLRQQFETISSKVRFILGVIAEEIKISRVKKSVLVSQLRSMGFKTASQLNDILPEKKRPSVQQDQPEQQEEKQEEEPVAPGEISLKEYDYLLTMQIMSLTEEKVIELQKQMKDKK